MTIDVEFCITYKSTVKYEIYKVKKIRTVEQFVIQRSTLPFRGEEPNFQEQLQSLEVAASIIQHRLSLTSFNAYVMNKNLN